MLSRRALIPLLLTSPLTPTLAPTLARAQPIVLRVGHFPNITHVQALVAHGLSRRGAGWFEERLGGNVRIEWFVYNAGPSAMEAIFADSIDLTYVGPSPVINAYVRAKGEAVRIVAGAAEGGAALVVQANSTLRTPADFRGRKIATPQIGNTQDVAARAWLMAGGLKITMTGGDAHVVPTANPDQLALFKAGRIDAVWTVEPWVSRLEMEAGGKVLVDERQEIATVLVASAKCLDRQRDVVRRFVAAHVELTDWIKAHPQQAQDLVREELTVLTRSPIKAELIANAWRRITVTATIDLAPLENFVAKARDVGFLRTVPDLGRLIERL